MVSDQVFMQYNRNTKALLVLRRKLESERNLQTAVEERSPGRPLD